MNEIFKQLQGGLPERYTLMRKIGAGGMSTVYLAQERHPSRQVAVKVLDPQVAVRLGRERFLREIDFVSKLTHPHIVPIFAAGDAAGLLFYVMPYVEGESLSERVRRVGALPLTTALRIAREVAGALEYAHRHNVLHRDIKPDNILLHDGYALVTDFGVAKAIRAAGDSAITETGLTLGTVAYMGPEQATGREDVDGRADVYSLGCVLYEMLTGKPPFGRGSPERVLPRQIAETPASLTQGVSNIPREVDQAVQKSLLKNRDQRYATAGEFEAALDDLRTGLTSGSGITAVTGASEKLGRWRAVAGLAGIAAIVAVTWQVSSRRIPAVLSATTEYTDSVAVKPIENLTGDPNFDHLGDAITYGAVSALSRIPTLKTSSYQSVRSTSLSDASLAEIVNSLRVRLIVAAQFRRVADQFRLDAELVDGVTGRPVGNGSWPVDPSDERAMERGLVSRLVELVADATGITPARGPVVEMSGPARDAYLLGKHWLGRRTPDGVNRAINNFRDAIALDSTYAAAYEGLSSAYMAALGYRYEIGMAGYEVAGRAVAAANRAIELGPQLAGGYAARGFAVSRTHGPTREAAADFGKALELSPNAAQAVAWSGFVLATDGQVEAALAASHRGAELDPLSPGRHFGLAMAALSLGQYDLTVRAARRATQLEPEILESRALEGRALVLAERADECLAIEFGVHDGVRALCIHAVGRTVEARAIIDSLSRAVQSGTRDEVYTDVVRAEDLATYYALTGDIELALHWVEHAYDLSPRGIRRRVLDSPLFDSVRESDNGSQRLAAITGSIWNQVKQHARAKP